MRLPLLVGFLVLVLSLNAGLAPAAPGERRAVRFDAFLPARTPPGRYRVRFRYGRAQSGWIGVEIGG